LLVAFLDNARLAVLLVGVDGLVPLWHVGLLEMDFHTWWAFFEFTTSEEMLFGRREFCALSSPLMFQRMTTRVIVDIYLKTAVIPVESFWEDRAVLDCLIKLLPLFHL
jgi:hypothetical protein